MDANPYISTRLDPCTCFAPPLVRALVSLLPLSGRCAPGHSRNLRSDLFIPALFSAVRLRGPLRMRYSKSTRRRQSGGIELLCQGYVIVSILSTSGLDVLLMVTLMFLIATSLRVLWLGTTAPA
jgi:hypothetical protein